MPIFLTPGSSGAFHVARPGKILTLATSANGNSLPDWMTFDRVTSTLNYHVPIDFDGSIDAIFAGFVDTAPLALRHLPFRVINPAGFGGAYLIEDVIDTFRRVHADTIVAGKLFVDPANGNDNNAGTVNAPLRTIAAALASRQASEIVLAGGTYTEDIDFRDGSIAKILTSTGPVTFLVPGADLSDLAWTDIGNGLWRTIWSGPPLNTLLSNKQNDIDGFDARLVKYSSATALLAATSGWMIDGDQLTIKTAAGQSLNSFLTEYDALYSGDFLIYGANLAMSGDFLLRGISVLAFADGDKQAEFWSSGITSFRAPGLAFIGYGGDLILENSRAHASVFDGLNANISGAAASLILDFNFRASMTGDFAAFGEPQFGTSQGSSAHAGVNHLSIGSLIDRADGQAIADVNPGQSWILDLSVSESLAHPSLRSGITAVGLDRVIYVDGVIGDASLTNGTLQAAQGAIIVASEVTGTLNTSDGGQINLVNSNAGDVRFHEIVADSGALGSLVRGSIGSDVLIGADTNVRLAGGAGDDLYYVNNAANLVIEFTNNGYDRIYASVDYMLADYSDIELLSTADHAGTTGLNLSGGWRNDLIYGNAGPNMLNGGAGADVLIGQEGNDSYLVDNPSDYVRERENQGFDRVYASVDYRLPAGQEIEMLTTDYHTGTSSITLIGNEFSNIIFGNAGNNYLIGGGGADSLYGGAGDDRYDVDSSSDFVREYANEGYDRVYASVDYRLPAGQEIEMLTTDYHAGTNPITLIGNTFNNVIFGNAGKNYLIGGGGTDALYGGAGDDLYEVDSSSDFVREYSNEGYDRVYASASYRLPAGQEIEQLSTTDPSSKGAINLSGNEKAQAIYGNAGANRINGGGGEDFLKGNGGADVFVFDTPTSRNGEIPYIADFWTDDRIALSRSVFSALDEVSSGTLDASNFVIGTEALDANDHILFDPNTGALAYDPDGVGGQDAAVFAMLNVAASLTITSIEIIG
jgi:Ca2+-binding RTX toxin-like protein